MIDATPEFNELDEKLIALLSQGRSKAEAARECGVCRETVSRKWHGSEDCGLVIAPLEAVKPAESHTRRPAELGKCVLLAARLHRCNFGDHLTPSP